MLRIAGPLFLLVPLVAFTTMQAHAQAIQATGSGQPDRYVNGQPAAQCSASPDQAGCTRDPQFNPAWASYSDCEANLVLHFQLVLSGFAAADDLQVWISPNTGECISQGSRSDGSCWKVFDAGVTASAGASLTAPVWVRDVVGNTRSEAACHNQPDDNPIQFFVWFLAVNAQTQAVDGTPYRYSLQTDLVGPAPPGVSATGSLAIADGSLNLTWTPSSDANVQGYYVYMDPAPGPQPNAPTPLGECDASTTTYEVECPEAGVDEGGAGASEAGAAPEAGAADSGCVTVAIPGNSSNTCSTQCTSGALISTSPSANLAGGGGITTIPASFQVMTVAGSGSSSATLGNLLDGTEYNVVLSSYDSVNNIGPPTLELCQTPSPVGDFFRNYRQAGGNAGGGFCTLENAGGPIGTGLAGVAIVVAAVGAVVRKRRR